jgi:hypothetical protein
LGGLPLFFSKSEIRAWSTGITILIFRISDFVVNTAFEISI